MVNALLALLPSALLIGVALHQRWRMWRHNQWSWKGGGFAMFSDTGETVPITELWTEDSNGETSCLQLADPSDARLRWAKVIPTKRHMSKWADAVASGSWQRCGIGAHALQPANVAARLNVRRVVIRDRTIKFEGTIVGVLTAVDRARYEVLVPTHGTVR